MHIVLCIDTKESRVELHPTHVTSSTIRFFFYFFDSLSTLLTSYPLTLHLNGPFFKNLILVKITVDLQQAPLRFHLYYLYIQH